MAHRELVPDQENSAFVVSEALALLPGETWPLVPPSSEKGEEAVPELPATHPLKIYDQLKSMPGNIRLSDQSADALRRELTEQQEPVELMRKVADFARGKYEVEMASNPYETRLPHAEAARGSARLMAADAAIRAHDGDLDGALDSCRAEIGVARSIGDEPIIISQLVRIALDLEAVQIAQRVIGQGEATDAALARLQTLFLDEMAQPLVLHGLRGERATLVEVTRQHSLGGEASLKAFAEGTSLQLETADPTITSRLKLYLDLQLAITTELTNQCVAIERKPAADRRDLWQKFAAKMQYMRSHSVGRVLAMLPLTLFPAVKSFAVASDRMQTELAATAILLAAERHRRKTGQWPTSIESIDGVILPVAPADLFSNKPFHIEHRDGRLFVYSVGPNRKDEHGAFDSKTYLKGGPDDYGASAWDVPLRRQPATRMTPSSPGGGKGGSS